MRGSRIASIIIDCIHAVTFTFNGTVLPEPNLLFHDEISVDTSSTSGVLTCTFPSITPLWRNVLAVPISSTSSLYRSTSSGSGLRLYRTGASIPNNDQYNGLFSCTNRGIFVFIGIYNRGGGKLICYIVTNYGN